MVSALVKDLARLPGIEVTAARDGRLAATDLTAQIVAPPPGCQPWQFWSRCIDEADAVWPIAPETGGVLERLSRLVLHRGRLLLGSRPEAVSLCASKLATARHLESCGVPAVPAFSLREAPVDRTEGWVLKPDDGAGAEDTFLLQRLAEASRLVPADAGHRFVLQPFVAGTAASLSVLCRDGGATLLSCNRQDVSRDGARLRYRGGVVGGLEGRRTAWEPIARAVARAVPGLWGYVGIDLIDGIDGPQVIDINPRLTTSYVGLRRATGVNPAGLVLDLLDSAAAIPAPPGPIHPVTIDLDHAHD